MAELELHVDRISVEVEGKKILTDFNLEVRAGEVHALMGRNGSGKSTLTYVLMGHPKYVVTAGKILFRGENITQLSPDERAKRGLFLAFQYPVTVPGVTVANFLREACRQVHGEEFVKGFRKLVKEKLALLEMDQAFMTRYLNEGFSGGEKKRLEVLQMLLLNPRLAILDEMDSGLDVDALKLVAEGINQLRDGKRSFLIITHYHRMLEYIRPDRVHILYEGKIAREGDWHLAQQLDRDGYEAIIAQPT